MPLTLSCVVARARSTAITRKPFMVLTSMHDDVLEGDEMAQAAHAIGPNRTLVQLCHARHDVFMSAEASVIRLALDSLRAWLLAQGFLSAAKRRRPRLQVRRPQCLNKAPLSLRSNTEAHRRLCNIAWKYRLDAATHAAAVSVCKGSLSRQCPPARYESRRRSSRNGMHDLSVSFDVSESVWHPYAWTPFMLNVDAELERGSVTLLRSVPRR